MSKKYRHQVIVSSRPKQGLEFCFSDVQKKNPKSEHKVPQHLFCRGPRVKELVQQNWWDNVKPGK